MNYAHVIGRLTADPVQREVAGAVCTTFTVAADRRRKDANGNKMTNFWRITAWRQLGETCAQYLHKGDRTAVVCDDVSVQTYKDTKGEFRASLEGNAATVEFLTSKSESAAQATPAPAAAPMPAEEDELPF